MSQFVCLSKVSSFLSEFSLSSDLQRESLLEILDYNAVTDASTSATTQVKKRNWYQKWSASSVRRFVKLYKDELKNASKEKRNVNDKLIPIQRGRKSMLGSLDQKVQNYLRSYRSLGGQISTIVAVTIAKVLITTSPELELQHIDLDSSSWAKSLFQRMRFVRRMKTTGKPEISAGARKEA